MVSDKQRCFNYFDRTVDKLYNLNQISSKHVSKAKKEYFQLVYSAQNEHKDAFLSCLRFFLCWSDAWKCQVYEMLEFLKDCVYFVSWTQCCRKRISKLLVENLQQTSLINQRLICHYISDFPKPISKILLTIEIEMLKSCWLAHLGYVVALEKSLKWKF